MIGQLIAVIKEYEHEQFVQIMRYTDLSDVGGFLWWVLVKQRKSNLIDERREEKWARNIFFLVLLGALVGFMTVRFL